MDKEAGRSQDLGTATGYQRTEKGLGGVFQVLKQDGDFGTVPDLTAVVKSADLMKGELVA